MNRRVFLETGLAAAVGTPLLAALKPERLDDAQAVLDNAVASGQVASAVLHVMQREETFTRHFGKARSADAMFLLGSISKPICVAALMTLLDRGQFQLDDRVQKFLPAFQGEGRDGVTLRNLLTHVSGLPDQLPENNDLRKKHAGLAEFVEHAARTPLLFAPGSKYQYSSMGILLATWIAQTISGIELREFVSRALLGPLEMKHSALGLGPYNLEEMVPVQTEHAAPESGAGDPAAKDWDWNSSYWRKLGAPWGGVHASAPDIGRFLAEFLFAKGRAIKPETAKLMIRNNNAEKITPRGLGFNVGASAGSPGCSEKTFGHTGSTGTLAWADPASDTICVVLTSLPGGAVRPHPREATAARVAAAAG